MEDETNDVQNNSVYKQIRESEYKMEQDIKEINQIAVSPEGIEAPVVDHLGLVLTDILSSIRAEQDPTKLFTTSLQGLSKVQQEQFLLNNLLESLKAGKNYAEITKRFERLGLLPEETTTKINASTPQKDEPDSDSDQGLGKKIKDILRPLGRFSTRLAKIAALAAKAAGQFVEVTPIIGFVGPVPSLSLQLQSKGASVAELFEVIFCTGEDLLGLFAKNGNF